MIDVAHLKPSDLEKLKTSLPSGELVTELLEGLESFLQNVEPDGGADTDRIRSVAQDLTVVGAWKHINAPQVAERLQLVSANTTAVFVGALPKSYAKDISYELIQSDASPDFDVSHDIPADIEPDYGDRVVGRQITYYLNRKGIKVVQVNVKKKQIVENLAKKTRAAAIASLSSR